MPNQRTGKIARAPFAVRTRVNELLRDGTPYAQIIGYLAEQGIADVNDVNVHNWKDGGYQDWLAEQSKLDEMRAKREFALAIATANEGTKIHEAGLHLVASQIFEVLEDFDVADLKEALKGDPENYARVVSALAKISKEALGFEKFKQLVADQKRKIEEALGSAKSKGGITPEALRQIEEAAAML